ncbi:MAG: LacI family DNA-binding transcriptional regulator [Anaerolineae bacterium]|nr:LacI family DNA-binding transcriptional regulator [Anaerolineae bacterium]
MSGATVYDVAQKAGVSIATVSRVLNSPERVKEATRARVLAAIDALGYEPKVEAAERARKTRQRIGVLAPFFTQPSFTERLSGIAAALAHSPYELVIYSVDSAARRDAYLNSLAVTHRLDGLIVISLEFADQLVRRLIAHELNTVVIEFHHPDLSSIEIDDEAGGRLVAEYLISRGHRRFGFVGDKDLADYAIRPSDRRLRGFRAALEQAGLQLPDDQIALAPHGLEQARQQAHRLLDQPEPPSAIFAASDTQAMGVLKGARERGVAVPEQLAIVGFDDLEIADYIGLTTVRQHLQESGRVAVELLLARLADRSRPVQHVELPLTLVSRWTA